MRLSGRLPGSIAVLAAASLPACGSAPAAESAADPNADAAQNIRLVGHDDLQGRESLVVTVKSDAANGSWVYVGHHDSYWDGKPKPNPITGRDEWNGTSIVDVTDAADPRLVWHIPNATNANSRGVSVVYDYTFDASGRDYLIRNSEAGGDLKFQIGHDVPKVTSNSHPAAEGQPTVIQINDVDLDERGLAYASDRAGAGLFILRRTGTSGRSGT